jgi:hypothetical protein
MSALIRLKSEDMAVFMMKSLTMQTMGAPTTRMIASTARAIIFGMLVSGPRIEADAGLG